MSEILCDFYLGDCRRCDRRADANNQQEPCARPHGRFSGKRVAGEPASIDPEVLEPVLQKRIDRLNRTATDRAYMIEALAQMLGPKARRVWAGWQAQGVQRIHSDWVVDPVSMDGEDVAQVHLDMEEAMKNAVVVEDVDAHIAQCRFDNALATPATSA